MRTVCWVRRLAVVALGFAASMAPAATNAQQRLAIAPGRSLACLPHSEQCVLRSKGHLRVVTLTRDAAVLPQDTATLKLVAALPSAAIVIDSYSSKPGGAQACQAGTESFLRVLSFARAGPVKTYSVKLESCVQIVELALDGVRWDAATHRLAVHWLAAPAGQKARDVVLSVDAAGRVR